MPGTVRNIILDLGNVLVKVDENKFVTGVLGEGVSKQEFDGVFGSGELKNKFETGKISEREFLAAAIKGLNTGITTECLAHHWNSVFSEIPEMKKFVETFLPDKQYFSILLSNTNPLHFHYIRQHYGFINLLDRLALSYELGFCKPDVRIYEQIIRLYDIRPEESIFIDDLEANCESASLMNFRVIKYENFEKFQKDFYELTNSS